MSVKSFIQILILLLIVIIIGGVYIKYFAAKKDVVEEINLTKENISQLEELEKKISDLELKNKELNKKIEDKNNESTELLAKNVLETKKIDENTKHEEEKSDKIFVESKNEKKIVKEEIRNLVKDVEYISVDQRGNRFHLLANSGKTNNINKNILELENVRGEINSDKRDTIYIVSDYAQYNSTNLNSKFYQNVIINYQNKKITCLNFDINMETNKAIAYNNVIITDPQSIMKAGIVEFDLKTKNVNINPESSSTKIEVTSD